MIPIELLKEISENKAVLFLGAGASKQSGGPIGCELTEFIANELNIQKIQNSDLAIFTQYLIKSNYASRKEIELAIKNRLQSLPPSNGYKAMTVIPWKEIYSVNFDDLVEQSYKSYRGLYDCKIMTEDNLQDEIESNQIPLYKMHGSIGDVYSPQKPLVITYDDLINPNSYKEQLIKRLTNRLLETVIFIGYSFSDGVIEEILKSFKRSGNFDGIKRKYAVLPTPSDEDKLKYQSIYNIEIIDMKSDDFFLDVKNHFDQEYRAKLRAFSKSLSIFCGNSKVTFDPQIKSLIDNYFEYYDENKNYPNDANCFYRCGAPHWGNIKMNLDINRNVLIDGENYTYTLINTTNIPDIIFSKLQDNENKITIYKITGPIAVGKSTLCYRIAYELYNKGVLALFSNTSESIRPGLLTEIHKALKRPFVVIVDDAVNYDRKISMMIKECEKSGLEVSFIIAVRENDWECLLDYQFKRRLNNKSITIRLEDKLDKQQSTELAEKLFINNILIETVEQTKQDLIKKFVQSKNLVASLMTSIENTDFEKKLAHDYDRYSPETQNAYGIISLVNRLCLPFKWELLQRSLYRSYCIEWDVFTEKVIKAEAKGNIIQYGYGANYYFSCRHNLIAQLISDIHYKGDRFKEIKDLKNIILSVNKFSHEEIFIGKLVQYIVSRGELDLGYSYKQIIEILDCAILNISNPYFLLHVKGQYIMESQKDFDGALKCFNKCIDDEKNLQYALHSAAMAHFNIASSLESDSGVRHIEIRKTKDLLIKGSIHFPDNPFFYKTMLQLLDFDSCNSIHESNYLLAKSTMEKYKKYCSLDKDPEVFDLFEKLKMKQQQSLNQPCG
ncbi:SIR2 family NAD-dependent protein deacylase [Ruminiclostridium cellulolyticum]|uniref:Novel STAND NTPase 5 domain-containing protein n=1 Tax=Ruminiclostridium cellulolyticum (strain ATCC 35319 / DSM 5812 / JCM 6584 / H10) TaxID=394503 RepID=B8I4A6_RUMCH|nr:SIR2 family protein [Ruminiclostridium cellulolyticum]ACL74460.1 hypothetical protein Ccel_0072 [Ruminiclostridium cellulolyticum H10]